MEKLLECRMELEKHRLILNDIAVKLGISHYRTIEVSRILDALIVRESQLSGGICFKYSPPPDTP